MQAQPAAQGSPADQGAERWVELFEHSPSFVAVLGGADHRFEAANPRYLALVGRQPLLGRTFAEALPEASAHGHLGLLDQVFTSGLAHAAQAARYPTVAADGTLVSRFVDFVYQPLKDAGGAVTGILISGVDVSDRVRAEAALRETDVRFHSALTAGRMGSWETDHSTKTRIWSQEGMALFGLTLTDGRGQVDGPNDEYVAAMHPDDRHLALRFRELADQVDSFSAEYRIVRPDGSTVWLSGRGLVVARFPDGRAHRLVSIMADATEHKQAEDQLRIGRERLEQALSAGQMGAYDLNIKQGVLWWSPQTYALFGVDPASFVPSPETVTALIHPDDRETFARHRAEAIAQRRSFAHELRVLRPDGVQVWLDYRSQAEYDTDGRPLRNFGIVLDITERKHLEQMLRDANRQKDNFIATLAHELRNPLAPIRNALELARKAGSTDPTIVWCFGVMERQVGQMARLLDDLLDVSRISRGQVQLRLEPLQLSAAMAQAIEIAQPLIDAGRHTLTVDQTAEALPLEGDLTRLAQVFSNVLINAAKYTPPGGRIAVRIERQGDHGVVTITDNGIGIAAEHMPRIFTMFGQVDSALHRSQGGQGIGLSLSKGLVELHGGSIGVRSDGVGKGSQFEIRLPLTSASATATSNEAVSPAGATAATHQRALRILIADDMPDIADSFAMLLEGEGHVVEVAYDGEQALRLAESLRPDVVILDLGMPKLNGYEVCRQIRAAAWGQGMTLVAQTGWGQAQDRQRTREAGFDIHAVKPIDPFAVMDSVLRLRQPA